MTSLFNPPDKKRINALTLQQLREHCIALEWNQRELRINIESYIFRINNQEEKIKELQYQLNLRDHILKTSFKP